MWDTVTGGPWWASLDFHWSSWPLLEYWAFLRSLSGAPWKSSFMVERETFLDKKSFGKERVSLGAHSSHEAQAATHCGPISFAFCPGAWAETKGILSSCRHWRICWVPDELWTAVHSTASRRWRHVQDLYWLLSILCYLVLSCLPLVQHLILLLHLNLRSDAPWDYVPVQTTSEQSWVLLPWRLVSRTLTSQLQWGCRAKGHTPPDPLTHLAAAALPRQATCIDTAGPWPETFTASEDILRTLFL